MKQTFINYSGLHLDRAGNHRRNASWVSRKLHDSQTLAVPVWRNKNLFEGVSKAKVQPAILENKYARKTLEVAETTIFLGLDNGHAVFAAILSKFEESEAKKIVGKGDFIDLRQVGSYLETGQAALLAFARGMDYWHQTHLHCGKCGHPTETRHGGHMRLCSNSHCGKEVFPRTDPAVIMLIESPRKDDGPRKCLLARHERILQKMYSTLAGFVEPGETLEEAVAREVYEEVGIRVKNITYMASQPWPFPASIMLGFRAEALTMKTRIDPEELTEAKWFEAGEVKKADRGEKTKNDLILSPKDSIARSLIRTWLDDQAI